MISYILEEEIDNLFQFVEARYSNIEEVPRYREEYRFDEFCGVLKQARSDTYYPSLLDKAVYLVVGINKGHFFSNGNKRLALVTMTSFLAINNLEFRDDTKDWYKETLEQLFPEYQRWEDFHDFTPIDLATYNLSIMIADSGVYNITHDELKRRVRVFLEKATESVA